MIFNSAIFLGFFLVVYVLYLVLPFRWQNRLLLVASYLFYGWWDWRFLSLILISTLVDYIVGIRIAASESSRGRKQLLLLSVTCNLGLLAFFKYANFFADSLITCASQLGFSIDWSLLEIVLPVGISFYTFQTMSYTIDIYRGKLTPTRDILDFALFVSYFPQLVAGPIERARILIPQLTTQRRLQFAQLKNGCWLILSGYYLKCVLADNLAPFVRHVFESPEFVHGYEIVVGLWAAAFQIYGDFSGYSRIAVGVSKLLGIDLMQNFDRPYLSISPSEFWSRWHISLSTWLRDYLYISLGGNRCSTTAMYRNLMVTMLLGGLWHGAAWNFVLWGLYQGALLCIWRACFGAGGVGKSANLTKGGARLRRALRTIIFFHVTCIGWAIFFVRDVGDLWTLAGNCASGWNWQLNGCLNTLLLFGLPVVIYETIFEWKLIRHSRVTAIIKLAAWWITGLLLINFGAFYSENAFIYFQF